MTRTLIQIGLASCLVALSGGIPVALALPSGVVPQFAPIADPATLCQAAINLAQGTVRTPPGLLAAIAMVESGRRDPSSSQIAPWPWTINANGTGHAYPTEAAAMAAVRQFQIQGINSLDIGCMQINLQQHPDAFASLAQAFDPAANALYGADFLRRLKTRLGGWNPAIAAYHSQTPDLGLPYEQKVLAAWQDGAAPKRLPVAAGMTAIPLAIAARNASKTLGKSSANADHGAIATRHFGLGGFAFASLHGIARILPIATPVGQPGAPVRAMPGRGLVAYRRAPIPITGAIGHRLR